MAICSSHSRKPKRFRALLLSVLILGGWALIYYVQRPANCFARARPDLQDHDPTRLERLRYELLALQDVRSFEAEASLLRAKLLIEQQHPVAALDELLIAESFPHTRLDAKVLAGEALYRSDHFVEAGSVWMEVVAMRPDCVAAHRWLGAAYFELGVVPEAQEHLLQVARLAPADPRPHRVIGLSWRRVDEFQTAVDAYRESLRRDPQQPDADEVRFELADCLYRLNQNEEALKLLDQCPLTPQSRTLRAACHYNLAQPEVAVQVLDEVIASDPRNVRALSLRGKIALDTGDMKTAERYLKRATQVSPRNVEALHSLMAVNLRLGNYDTAKAQEKLLAEINKLTDEYHDLVSEAARDPTDPDIRYELGLLAFRLDYRESAKSWLQATVRLDPANQNAVTALEKLNSPYETDQNQIGD